MTKCICQNCDKEFNAYPYQVKKGNAKYCSRECYLENRWKQNGMCNNCGKPTTTRFCSKECQKYYWDNNSYRIYDKQNRYWKRKIKVLEHLGGKCVNCGNDDIRVLDINHKIPEQKAIAKHGGYSWSHRLKDWESNLDSLEILCANCHRIHTWDQRNYGNGKII